MGAWFTPTAAKSIARQKGAGAAIAIIAGCPVEPVWAGLLLWKATVGQDVITEDGSDPLSRRAR